MKKTKAKAESTEEQKPTPEPVQKIREEIKQVKYSFSNQEMLDLGKELAGKTTDLGNVSDEAKSVAKSYKSKEAEIEGAIGVLTEKIKTGYELRPMKCRVVFRAKEGKKDYFRADTGELALTEQMTNADLQMDLFLENKKQAAGPKVSKKDLDGKQLAAGEGIVSVPMPEGNIDPKTIEIWPDTVDISSRATVYKESGLWFCSVTASVADWMYFTPSNKLKGCKERFDAIKRAIQDLRSELESALGEGADGFQAYLDRVLESEVGKVE